MKLLNKIEQRQIYLEMMIFFHNYCVSNAIQYFLAYGTLLGAVRHKGFIPWDDDVDIFMPRKDYDFLLTKFNNLYSKRYKLFHFTNSNSIHSRMIYLVDSYTCKKSDYDDVFVDSLGINLDIFPIDNVPDSSLIRFFHRQQIALINNLFLIKTIPISPYRNKSKNWLLSILQFFLKPLSFEFLSDKLDGYCSKYKNITTKYVNSFYSPYNQKKSFMAIDFSSALCCSFENQEFFIPRGYDSILTKTYGNYMLLPPEEKRLPHQDHMEYFLLESK